MNYAATLDHLNQLAGRTRGWRPHDTPAAGGYIRPELLGAKLEAARHMELMQVAEDLAGNSWLPELLWYLQWVSFQPGGLRQLIANILEQFPDRIGFAALHEIKPALRTGYSDAQLRELFSHVPRRNHWAPFEPDTGLPARSTCEELRTPEQWLSKARSTALERLPAWIWECCQSPGTRIANPSCWYFSGGIWETLRDMYGRHTRQTLDGLAHTSIFEAIREECDFTQHQKSMGRIIGGSRLGKTIALKAIAKAEPGRYRHVETPSTDDLAGLVTELGCPFGLVPPPGYSPQEFKGLVQYVYRTSGVCCLLDEAQFLVPGAVSKRTRPKKLNWIRRALVDHGIPVMLSFTPQGVGDWEQFEKVTSYSAEQFYGRLCVDRRLPDEAHEADIDLVARFQFAGYPEAWAEKVAARALKAKGRLQAVIAIHQRAQWHAHRSGSDRLTVQALFQACEDIVPSKGNSDSSRGATAGPPPDGGREPADDRQLTPKLSRGMTPAAAGTPPRSSIIPEMAGA